MPAVGMPHLSIHRNEALTVRSVARASRGHLRCPHTCLSIQTPGPTLVSTVARGSTKSQTWRNTPSFTLVSWRPLACRKTPGEGWSGGALFFPPIQFTFPVIFWLQNERYLPDRVNHCSVCKKTSRQILLSLFTNSVLPQRGLDLGLHLKNH